MTSRGVARTLAVAAAALGLSLLPGVSAAAGPGVEPEAGNGPAIAEGVPGEVAAWFRDEGRETLTEQAVAGLDLDPEVEEEAVLGLVRPVTTWSPEFVEGAGTTTPVAETGEWMAPVRVADEGVGVLRVTWEGGEEPVRLETLEPAPDLAAAVLALAADDPLVHDLVLDAWFAVIDGEVRPVDEDARDSLAGSLPVEDYQPFVVDRYSEPGAELEAVDRPTWTPAAWTAGIIAVVLAWTALVVWLRRENA